MKGPLSVLCGLVDDAIEALDGRPWATASLAAPTWRRSKQPLSGEGSALDQHLLFLTTIEAAPATGEAGSSFYQVAPQVQVVFLFKAGAGEKVERERLASDAALTVAEAVIQYGPLIQYNVECRDPYTPGAMLGDFLPVRLRFEALVDIPYRWRA